MSKSQIDTLSNLRVRTNLTLRYARWRVRSQPIGYEIAVSRQLEDLQAALRYRTHNLVLFALQQLNAK
jgi:hypothetical protein